MKKFWIVLLALGLVAGFAMSASAADVKFSGQYYVTGSYSDNPSLLKDGTPGRVNAVALYNQRLRLQTEFKIAEGLMLVTRFDAIEKDWGDYRWRGESALAARVDNASRPASAPAGINLQESIEFERAYVDFTTKIGRFMVGYQNFIAFGTMFLDSHGTRAGIKYIVPIGPLTVIAAFEKGNERSVVSAVTDADQDIYDLGVVFKFGAGDAGLMIQYIDNRTARVPVGPASAVSQFYGINPYARIKLGPVYIETEGLYGGGKLADFEGATPDVDLKVWAYYLHAKADIGPAYVGGIFAFASGDDASTATEREGTMARLLTIGQAWDPCVLLYNDEYARARTATMGTAIVFEPRDVFFDNGFLFQIYGGIKPVKNLDIMASLTYARLDRAPRVNQSYEVGYEVDLVAKYKIFDNLEYKLGGGYLFTGDAFKGGIAATKIANDYLLFHKLTLSF
jgi:hypothetical protein